MKFEEFEDLRIDKKELNENFIYFLIKNETVVYVGKTQKGIFRLYAHDKKDYDYICIKYCSINELDELENKFILKYKPIYNKMCNNALWYGLRKVVRKLRKETGIKNMDLIKVNYYMDMLKIKPLIKNNVLTISVYEYENIVKYIKGV